MKIAVACEKNLVAEHFGHCEAFHIYQLEEGRLVGLEEVENPGHKKGFLPVFLDERGVDLVISGSMGQGAIDIFKERDIEVLTGAQGEVDKVIEAYVEGRLETSGDVCNRHEHAGDCGGH